MKKALILLVTLSLFASGALFASDPVNVSSGLTAAGGPLALHGYDAVSYRQGDVPQRGLAKFSAKHEGAVYRFASKSNLRDFVRSPEKFAPQYGGFCAYGASVGKKFDGDPEVFKIVDDRLYLNLNPEIKEVWLEDVPGNIVKADQQWPKIETTAASDL